MIISGKYEGNYLVLNDQKISFISKDPIKLNADTFVSTMYKDDIKSITKESEHASGNKERIAFWLGSIAAAGVSETKVFVVRIVWQDGQESLANIIDSQYQYILATQIKSNPLKAINNSANINQDGKAYDFCDTAIGDGVTTTTKVKLTHTALMFSRTGNKSVEYDLERSTYVNASGVIPYVSISQIMVEQHSFATYVIITHTADKDKFVVSGATALDFAKDVENRVQKTNPNFKITEKKNGCYVATCVYGSYDCPEVWTLRRFRDNTLGSTWYGRAFIRTYYAISPMIVKWFGNTAWFKKMWKGTLDRMVKKLEANGVENTPYEDKKW